jgi:hypothetical protein
MTKKQLLIFALIVYLGVTTAGFFGFRTLFQGTGITAEGGKPSRFAKLISPLVPKAGQGKADVKADAPKTEPCPLNGQLYSKAEREAWETRTPLAIMIENHPDARPQSGLNNADIIFEAVAEGGITRYMGMFYCGAQAQDIIVAPVRSARTYFIDWASSYQEPLYVHVGGANLPGPTDALGQLEKYKWAGANDLNQFSIGFPTFVRNYDRVQLADAKELATEHTMESSTERLWNYARDKRKITTWTGKAKFTSWGSKDDAAQVGEDVKITYDFWEGYKQFTAEWTLDPSNNTYLRATGGAGDRDNNTGEPLRAKNVVILFTTEKGPINENKHMLYGTVGNGKAIIFQDGKAVQATWQKSSRVAPLQFLVGGKPAQFNRGRIWISVVANGTAIEY